MPGPDYDLSARCGQRADGGFKVEEGSDLGAFWWAYTVFRDERQFVAKQ
jgi:hypothetical protein